MKDTGSGVAKQTPRRRRYDASGRRKAAEERRQLVLDVAARLFAENGWNGTTLTQVASEAGVSVELVTSAFGTKPGLLMAAMRRVSFGEHDLPSAVRALGLADEPDMGRRLDLVVELAQRALAPLAPLVPVLTQAADRDDDAAATVRGAQVRHREAAQLIAELVRGGPVDDELVDEVMVLTRSETFLFFTRERDWSSEQYGAWLRRALAWVLEVPAG
ncbi:TetR/AcrR family transcriptional regulator [Nocardioides nanhaiensis]|uniref:HTH tetR-type domain-containing protein n=1 Tax=Nocardioides nanhaiensis TaxID=1476871 RepID=A0ABP8VX31_9ACTN